MNNVITLKKIDGVSLSHFLNSNKRNQTIKTTFSCKSIADSVIQQQRQNSFIHGNVLPNKIMVDEHTGKFLTLVGWENAVKVVPGEVKYKRMFSDHVAFTEHLIGEECEKYGFEWE